MCKPSLANILGLAFLATLPNPFGYRFLVSIGFNAGVKSSPQQHTSHASSGTRSFVVKKPYDQHNGGAYQCDCHAYFIRCWIHVPVLLAGFSRLTGAYTQQNKSHTAPTSKYRTCRKVCHDADQLPVSPKRGRIQLNRKRDPTHCCPT